MTHLPPQADPCAFVRDFPPELDDAVVLVKGSRGMALERVVAALRAQSLAAANVSPRVVVAGCARRDVTARLVAAALGRAGCSDVLSASLDHHAFGGIKPVLGAWRVPHKTPVEGLWFVGAQSESGGGVNNVIPGAYKTARAIADGAAG